MFIQLQTDSTIIFINSSIISQIEPLTNSTYRVSTANQSYSGSILADGKALTSDLLHDYINNIASLKGSYIKII